MTESPASSIFQLSAGFLYAASLTWAAYSHSVVWAIAGCVLYLVIKPERMPKWIYFVWAVGALFLAWVQPSLSDDFQRYVWEGFVQTQGFDPYSLSPEDLMARGLEHPSGPLVNHPHLPAIYPPLAQEMFWGMASIWPHWRMWKLLVLLIWLFTIWQIKSFRNMAFSPLVLIEGLWNAHLDVAALLLLMLALHQISKTKAHTSGLGLAALIGIKTLPAIWVPFVWRRFNTRQGIALLFTCSLALLFLYLPYLRVGKDLFHSFLVYSQSWQFNNLLFFVLKPWVPAHVLRILFGLALMASLGLIFRVRVASLNQELALVWLALIVFSPTFYPWYLLWLVPLLPAKTVNGLFASAMLSYLILIPYRASGIWQETLWWLLPEWIGLTWCITSYIRKDILLEPHER